MERSTGKPSENKMEQIGFARGLPEGKAGGRGGRGRGAAEGRLDGRAAG